KLHYKIQIILTFNENIADVLDKFDLVPCCVAFDGKDVLFTAESYQSYKYMINTIDDIAIKSYSDLFDARLKKYFDFGFNIVLPGANISSIKENKLFKLSNCEF